MVVDVGNDEHGERTLGLRGKCLAQCVCCLRRHDSIERAVRIAFAGLVIEDEHNPARHAAGPVVVMSLPGRRDAVPGKHERPLGVRAAAEPLRIKILTGFQPQRRRISVADGELVRTAERRRQQVVLVEVRLFRSRRGEAKPLEA